MTDIVNWIGMTIMTWGLLMLALVMSENKIILNNWFFYGSFILIGILVLIILELMEYIPERHKVKVKSRGGSK